MKNVFRPLTVIIFLCMDAETLICQPELNWNNIYNYNGHQDYPSQILVDDSGNIYAVGQTEISNNPQTNFDALILKYNRTGTFQWFRKHSLATWGDDIFINAKLNEDGNILVSGNMQVGNTLKILNIMYSSLGDTLWTDVQDFSVYGWPYGLRNIFYKDSIYYIVDACLSNSDSSRIIILKYNKSGEFLGVNFSENIYELPQDIYFLPTESSFLYIYNKKINGYQFQPLIKKIQISGEKIWEKVLLDTTISIKVSKSMVDVEGNIYSISNKNDFGNSVFYITKHDRAGNLLWNSDYTFENDFYGSAINLLVNESGQIRIVGTFQFWNGTTNETGTFTAVYDSSGNQTKYDQQSISLPIQNFSFPKYDTEENVYIALNVVSPSTFTDILVAKINTEGILEYEKIYSHNNNETITEEAIYMCLVGEDDFAIAARECGLVEAFNILTLRYGDNISSLTIPQNPESYFLNQNYPNPFNPTTRISWQAPVAGNQILKVYDVLGNEVTTLVNEFRNAGSYEIDFQSTVGSNQLANGVYFYQLRVGDFVETKKMILLK